ncbi:HNH endonuclease [Emticicia sp. BO119]|uniref:HNH endonuclease n=1 Tax=Emticicia sp. BO119 TaxID=2757768 RepID=UPI0015EFF3C3|nr:HNH endonuclease [Emticicia sp. BO119]MBA4850974.1 HNH endonuclease [Emticicia sp. BO119]
MGRKVLVLNADYSALSICTVPKAFSLVYLDKAELVSDSQKGYLRTVDTTYPLPSVIRLHRYVSLPFKGVMLSRQNVFRRDGNKCVYCGSHEDLTLDHVTPKSKGGKTNWDNLVTACRRCNSRKGDLSPEEAKLSLSRKPYKPSFIMFLRDFAGSIEENWVPFLGIKEKT